MAGAVLLAGIVVARAADAPAGASGVESSAISSGVPFDAQLLKTGLYLIRGGGGNSLLRLTANGMILVDGQRAQDHRALTAQVRRISRLSDMSIRVLVLTGPGAAHAGDVALLRAARVGVLAQRRTLAALSLAESPLGAVASPVVAYDEDYALRLGGVEVRLGRVDDADAGGDTVVYFPDLRIVALGDLFTPDASVPQLRAGGRLAARAAALQKVLALDFDRVVPGAGPVAGRDALVAFEARLAALAACGDAAGAAVATDSGPPGLEGRERCQP